MRYLDDYYFANIVIIDTASLIFADLSAFVTAKEMGGAYVRGLLSRAIVACAYIGPVCICIDLCYNNRVTY